MSTDFPENNSKQNIKKNYSEPHSPNTDSCASTNLYLAHRIHKKTADPARSAAFSVYMSVKNTLLSEFFSEALVIHVKKLVNLFHNLLHNSHP